MGDLLQPWHLMILFFVFFCIFLLPAIFYILTLQNTLSRCAPSSRSMEPALVWLFIVPIVNLVFHFFIVFAISKSVANEFARRGVPSPEREPGQAIGLAMCVCACCSIIPFFGFLCAIAHLVLWILYWVKVSEFSRALSITPSGMTASQY